MKTFKQFIEENKTSSDSIRAEYDSMRKMKTSDLRLLYKRYHRVSDVSGTAKANLIADILRAKYGDKHVDAAFN